MSIVNRDLSFRGAHNLNTASSNMRFRGAHCLNLVSGARLNGQCLGAGAP